MITCTSHSFYVLKEQKQQDIDKFSLIFYDKKGGKNILII